MRRCNIYNCYALEAKLSGYCTRCVSMQCFSKPDLFLENNADYILQARLNQALKLLEYLEWSGQASVDNVEGEEVHIDCCPVCGACKEGSQGGDEVHVEDCELAILIGSKRYDHGSQLPRPKGRGLKGSI